MKDHRAKFEVSPPFTGSDHCLLTGKPSSCVCIIYVVQRPTGVCDLAGDVVRLCSGAVSSVGGTVSNCVRERSLRSVSEGNYIHSSTAYYTQSDRRVHHHTSKVYPKDQFDFVFTRARRPDSCGVAPFKFSPHTIVLVQVEYTHLCSTPATISAQSNTNHVRMDRSDR